MLLPDGFIRLARAHAYRRKLKFKRAHTGAVGWSMLGNGWFGEVWEHADYPGLVVKVSGRAGFGIERAYTPNPSASPEWLDEYESQPSFDSWQVYAQYCHKHKHQHLPNILHFERINASTAWAIMPKYNRYDPGPGQDFTRERWRSWLNGARGSPEWMWPIIGMATSLCMEVDLHRGNVMLDDEGTLIMTDPFSSMSS